MADQEPRSDTQIRINSRRGSTAVHPVAAEEGSIGRREIKQFKKWILWLIPSFVVANVVVFIVTMYVNDCPKNSVSCVARFLGRFSFQPLKENPLLGPSSSTLQKMGALEVNKVVHGDQVWRLVTCNWLHAGVFHLLANMLGLLVIGIRLEQEFGFIRIGLLYVVSGFGGSVLSALFNQSNISVGASGALFGLLGGMLSELITNWTIYSNKVAAFFTLLVIIAINLAVGILPRVDNFAHIGGFVSGFLLGFVFLVRPQFGWVSRSQRYGSLSNPTVSVQHKFNIYQCILWIISLILLIAGFTVGLVLLLRGFDANRHCSWCHYLSCIPTSKWSCNSDPAYCLSQQVGNQLNVTCSTNAKSGTYILPNASSSQIQSLCSALCNSFK
ncbi:RHOMBOID-like protein 1 [Momordica charantia]|uniref:RHOMBOID-like protein n=1 Tax=Momordica charantia TaxID=3673 RepID=A0A6J1CWW5_MOMCH|nr:RHOMBOID-like protein 1 [Momordica charantia]XP_022145538.1 RHOMBOID-like protein 1 [Momordica charantia]